MPSMAALWVMLASSAAATLPPIPHPTTPSAASPSPRAPVVSVLDFGAQGDGVADDADAFRRAYAALPPTGGTILVPRPPIRYRVSGRGATLEKPRIVLEIERPNVWIVGDAGASIFMDDFTKEDAERLTEVRGADVFTVILFNGVTGGGVTGLRFEGLGSGDGLTVGRARAKAIGITNSTRIRISHVEGSHIVGNLVNARGTARPDSTSEVLVTDSVAEACNESGFNFMGGTTRMIVANVISRDNGYHGLETGSTHLTVTGCVFSGNKDGMTHVGRYASITGNVLSGNRIAGFNHQWNRGGDYDGSFNVLTNNSIVGNGAAGIISSAKSHHNLISANLIADNGSLDRAGIGIELHPGCHDFDIFNNMIAGGRYGSVGIRLTDSARVAIRGNSVWDHRNAAIIDKGPGAANVIEANDLEPPTPVDGSGAGRGTSPSAPADAATSKGR